MTRAAAFHQTAAGSWRQASDGASLSPRRPVRVSVKTRLLAENEGSAARRAPVSERPGERPRGRVPPAPPVCPPGAGCGSQGSARPQEPHLRSMETCCSSHPSLLTEASLGGCAAIHTHFFLEGKLKFRKKLSGLADAASLTSSKSWKCQPTHPLPRRPPPGLMSRKTLFPSVLACERAPGTRIYTPSAVPEPGVDAPTGWVRARANAAVFTGASVRRANRSRNTPCFRSTFLESPGASVPRCPHLGPQARAVHDLLPA